MTDADMARLGAALDAVRHHSGCWPESKPGATCTCGRDAIVLIGRQVLTMAREQKAAKNA